MSRDLADLAVSLGRLPDAVQRGELAGVRRAALHVTRTIREEIRLVAGADMRLSGVGIRGARVGAGYDVKGRVNPTAIISARGPLHLGDRDTSAHEIRPRSRYRRGKKALRLPGGLIRASAQHPGTRGRHPFARGVARTANAVVGIYEEQIWRQIRGAFR